MKQLALGEEALTLKDVFDVAVRFRPVELSKAAIHKIKKAHIFLTQKVESGDTFYGINTGFGLLSNVRIETKDLQTLQYHLLRSHACGVGPALEDAPVRAMLLLRAYQLALGHSGVSQGLIEQLLAFLNKGLIPVVPMQGSVGASGDLAPLSHLALPLIGEGHARVKGEKMTGAQALKAVGLKPISLGPKEGLALINGTQFMTALGALNLLEAEFLCDLADMTGAISLEAFRGTTTAFDPAIHDVRPHPGQIQSAKNLRKILLGPDGKSQIAKSHDYCGRVQDPYSFRCMPQVHGAVRDALSYVRQVLEREINSVTDNPLVFPEANSAEGGSKEGRILSGGNFHGQTVAFAMDMLAISSSELGSISEQRLAKLINPAMSDLPAFLTNGSGLNSGFMIVQVAAASLVSENKTLCHPASVDSIPTSADKEDHVSMGAWAARKAMLVTENVRKVLMMELLAAAQGLDFLRPLLSSQAVEEIHRNIREKISKMDADRAFYTDFEMLDELICSEDFRDTVRTLIYQGDAV